ncbi:MAG: CoA pyrophosphatase, partial [Deltaproteobacteria bacterium]|nr:CoA pyrophosphatase [Deltaproteobacteria bacterium]
AHTQVAMPALPGRTNHLLSPIILPLFRHNGRLCVWATRRSRALRDHAGEICFPGGRPEANDDDLAATARRELREELGLEVGPILGALSRVPVYTSDYRLVPFVAEVTDSAAPQGQASEVAEILRLDVAAELSRPSIEAIPFAVEDHRSLVPVFAPLDQGGQPQGALMYGATAITFFEFLTVLAPLYGLPSPPKLVAGSHDWQSITKTLY